MGAGKPIYKSLYFQVITGICIGIALGILLPGKDGFAGQMKPFGDGFIKMIKMIIAPIIFCTCLLYTSPSPRDRQKSRMPSSA